jgi:hypothetical protein
MDVVQLCVIAHLYGLKAHVLVRRMEEELSEEDDSFYLSEGTSRPMLSRCTCLLAFHVRGVTDQAHFLESTSVTVRYSLTGTFAVDIA